MPERIEHDALGEKAVPADALWGIHTARALENFALGMPPTPPDLIRALALVKKACALANAELGYLPADKAAAIAAACDEVAAGGHAGQFPLDALQGGAGTSTNMNVNEVIANRALELLGQARGRYDIVSPLDHVNLHQSTNDVYPTALKVAAIFGVRRLAQAAAALQGAFQALEQRFADIPKVGKTELVDAVPITLGKEFSAFAEAVGRDRWRAFKCEERLRTVNLGGTAVGTGLAAPRSYIFLVIEKLREVTGLGLSRGENLVDQTANADALVEVAGILNAAAANLVKISSDLRLLQMLGQIRLPAVQAGSSIMPGKVNPVILESAIQAGLKVAANDQVVAACAARGSLQINEFLPLLGFALLESLGLLARAMDMLARHVAGIEADAAACRAQLDGNVALITPFVATLGYARALALLQEFRATGRGNLREFLAEQLGAEAVTAALAPARLVALGYPDHANHA